MSFDLALGRRLVTMSEHQVRALLGPDLEEDGDSGYEGLDDLVELVNLDVFPGSIFLADGAVRLVYVPRSGVEGMSLEQIERQVTGEPARLRSRAGKKATMRVWPEEGVAVSADAQGVHFVELFPPTTLEEYEREIYEEPPRFIR